MGFLSPTIKTKNVVGKSDEFGVTRSKYGDPITRAAGTDRFDGQVIWGREITQVKTTTTETSGGKGGPKQKTTTVTYEYFLNFAVSFATGIGGTPASDLLRIWADGKVIYDAIPQISVTEDETVDIGIFDIAFDIPGNVSIQEERVDWLQFRFYDGSEDQLPDPLIESFEGENNTPAYRGQAYIVFEDFKISDFGNRIPVITAEIAFEDAIVEDVQQEYFPELVSSQGTSESFFAIYDDTNKTVYIDVNESGPINLVYSVDTATATIVNNAIFLSGAANPNADEPAGIVQNGDLFFRARSASSLGDEMRQYDSDTGAIVKEIDIDHKMDGAAPIRGIANDIVFGRTFDNKVIWVNITNSPNSASLPGDFITVSQSGFVPTLGVSGLNLDAWVIYADSTTVEIWRGTAAGPTLYDSQPISAFGASALSNLQLGLHIDKVNNRLVFGANLDGSPNAIIYDIASRTVFATIPVPFLWGNYYLKNGADLDAGRFFIYSGGSGNAQLIAINLQNGTLDGRYNGTVDEGINFGPTFWIESQGALWGTEGTQGQGLYRYDLGVTFAASIRPQELITNLLTDAGLTPDQFDVSLLPVTVSGVASFVLRNREEFAEDIENLINLLGFEAAEVDGLIRFFPLGQSSSATIPVSRLVQSGERQGQAFAKALRRERDLPKVLEVTYGDVATDFQPGVQRASRLSNPVATALTERPTSFDYKGSGSADFMQGVAQRELYRLWAEIERYTYRVSTEFLDTAPGDVVTLDFENGLGAQGRIRSSDIGANFDVEIEQVVEVDGQYTVVGVGQAGPRVQRRIPNVGDTAFFLLNLPLLFDVDSAGQELTIFYFLANGLPVWPGSLLFSVEGTTLNEVGQQNDGFSGGVTVAAVPDPISVTRFENQSFQITVGFGVDNFTSTTIENVLAGQNTLAVIKDNGDIEIIQYKNAVLESDGVTVTFSDLLRGRRGTEPYATDHTAGETVLLLTTQTVERIVTGTSKIGVDQPYLGVTLGQLVEEGVTQTFQDRGEDLKPYSPVQLAAQEDGSGGIDLSWVRRTRIGGELSDGSDVPLSEQSESYEVDILDAPGGNVLRTLISATENVNYAAADVTTDFGAVPATLDVVVFQISAVVGRGKPAEETLEVLAP